MTALEGAGMHIPDGFISGTTAATTGVASAGTLGLALRLGAQQLRDRQIPLVGLTAAFVFAVQMINFPIGLGTSGHLLGGALAAILLGPWMGCVVLAVVLLVQALAFGDGGITALGANVLLMGVIAGIGGYWLFRGLASLLPKTRSGFLTATAVTSWATVVVASVVASGLITYGGSFGAERAGLVLGVMVGLHALIGVGEALITILAVGAVLSARPDLMATADLLGARVHEVEEVAA
jgi:cobalt/nickel transport system permease protein